MMATPRSARLLDGPRRDGATRHSHALRHVHCRYIGHAEIIIHAVREIFNGKNGGHHVERHGSHAYSLNASDMVSDSSSFVDVQAASSGYDGVFWRCAHEPVNSIRSRAALRSKWHWPAAPIGDAPPRPVTLATVSSIELMPFIAG